MGIATPPGPTPNSTDTPIQIRYVSGVCGDDNNYADCADGIEGVERGCVRTSASSLGGRSPGGGQEVNIYVHVICMYMYVHVHMHVSRERDGEPADLSMVRDVIGSFSEYTWLLWCVVMPLPLAPPFAVEVEEGRVEEPLRYYQDCFECPFLVETGQYYRLEAARMVAELSCSEYIKQVVIQLKTAKRAGNRFLHQTSVTKVCVCACVCMCVCVILTPDPRTVCS